MAVRASPVSAIWVGPFADQHNGITEYFRSIERAWGEDGRPIAARLSFADRRSYALQLIRVASTLRASVRMAHRPLVHLQFCPFSTGPGALLIAEQAKLLRLPLVTTIHEERTAVLTSRKRGYWRLYPLAEDRLLKLSDAIVVHSSGQRDRIPHRWREKATVIEFGVDACASCERSDPPVSRSVGCFGLIKPHKGLDTVVSACARAKAAVPDLQLRIVGAVSHLEKDRVYFRNLRDYARGALNNSVSFVLNAPAAEFDAAYHEVGVACFPLRQATQSTTFYRALRHGRPVVVTDVGGVADVTARERLGAVTRIDDIDAMADAITRVVGDRAAYGGYHASVRSYAKRRDWQTVAREHRELYGKVA